MTKALFLVDSYLKESPATVVSVKDGKYVTLTKQSSTPKAEVNHDTGKIIKATRSITLSMLVLSKLGTRAKITAAFTSS